MGDQVETRNPTDELRKQQIGWGRPVVWRRVRKLRQWRASGGE